jgi:hypothetical protein
MSASRAIASAKNRKAGGNNPNPATPQPVSSTPVATSASTNMSDPSVSKISIPQAIQLLGNRINNLEDFMGNTSEIIQDMGAFNTSTKDKYIVDAEVFSSLVNRIEAIEAMEKVRTEESLPKPVLKRSTNEILDNIPLSKAIAEIDTLKTNFIKLQTYVMQTNAKLSDIVFTTSGESVVEFRDLFNKNNATDISDNLTEINTLSLDSDSLNPTILTPPTLQKDTLTPTPQESTIQAPHFSDPLPVARQRFPVPPEEIKSMLTEEISEISIESSSS